MNLEPYQQAGQKIRKQQELPYDIATKAIGLAATVGLGGKILPLLSSFIPDDLRQKALSKIDPRLGSFLSQAAESGFDQNQIMDFLKNKFSEKQEKSTESKKEIQQEENPIIKEAKIFESDFPELAQGIANLMKSGRSPQEAADILKKSLPEKVKNAEKKLGKKFEDFINEIFGSQQQTMQPQQQSQSIPQPKGNVPQQGQGNVPQQGQGGVDPKLLQLVQGIRSSLEGMKGK